MNRYLEKIIQLKEKHNFRQLPHEDNINLIDLSSNDYLGLNANHKLRDEFLESYLCETSFSSSSSRLLGKSQKEHLQLENQLAKAYQKEAALLFNSGYHVNTGILPALCSRKDLIIADKLVHASLIDGAKLSTVKLIRYRHQDYQQLEKILAKERKNFENVFIVTESIFSMDGDLADINQLVEIKKKYDCFLFLYESHAFGVRG